jgi:hypothetical protein
MMMIAIVISSRFGSRLETEVAKKAAQKKNRPQGIYGI